MNDEQRRMALFGVQPCGKCYFCTLLRYFSLMCIQHIALEMPCSAQKWLFRYGQN